VPNVDKFFLGTERNEFRVGHARPGGTHAKCDLQDQIRSSGQRHETRRIPDGKDEARIRFDITITNPNL
jgi:hypothetical protein